jgi:signal transduction histidine kinase/DNA-binding response OmpR family regulator
VKRHALVVDDDPAILEVLGMRLDGMGLETVTTGDPQQAIAVLAERRFDVALLDLRMSGMDGLALMEALHERQPGLPVFIMTAHGTIETAVAAMRRGGFDYLTKPFQPDELRRKIGRALTMRRWAHDRERLLGIGRVLASSGTIGRVLDAVARATVDCTEAERCVVFLAREGQLAPGAAAGPAPLPGDDLEAAAWAAMARQGPVAVSADQGPAVAAVPLLVDGSPAGALVIQTPVAPSTEDLELLALLSSQASVALHNAHEMERLRGGAVVALGRVAAEVAHEVKNPLAGLLLYARHLENRLAAEAASEAAALARKISDGLEHLGSVVSEISAFGRPAELRCAPLVLSQLLDECLALAWARHGDEATRVVVDHDPGCPAVVADARELRRALLHLVVNGLEALSAGGRLDVRTTYAPAERVVTVAVDDTGVGMSEQTLARAFDLFFTTKPQGTGLGMAIARSTITLHGGTLSVESAPGQGTRVRVRLPVDGPGAGPSAPASRGDG